MKKNLILKTLALFGILLLSGCNEHEKEKGATQVIAKVNGEEVSVHQLNYVLSHTNNIQPENAEAAKKKILNNLVDVSILYQQALAEKLDRDPDVMMAVEQNKRQVIVQNWMQKIAKNAAKPTANEIEAYYTDHPDLFSQHKTFKIKEILINKIEGKQTALNDALDSSKKLDELLKKLDDNKIPYQAKQIIQGAENLPMEQLPTLAGLKDGQFITFDKSSAVLVLGVLSFTVENVDLAKATPVIEKYLTTKLHKELVEKAVKDLKDKAKVEYLGEFAALNSEQTANNPISLPVPAGAQPAETQPAGQQP
ncbi:MAG: EpsD family peptidyl-prolyl cis-trans isomerase [Methylomonas sp.]